MKTRPEIGVMKPWTTKHHGVLVFQKLGARTKTECSQESLKFCYLKPSNEILLAEVTQFEVC